MSRLQPVTAQSPPGPWAPVPCARARSADPRPGQQPAGVRDKGRDDTAGHSLQPDIFCPSSEPAVAAATRRVVGRSAPRRGQPPPPTGWFSLRHGRPLERSESAAALIQPSTGRGTASEFVNCRKEAIYESSRREPLGQPYLRGLAPPRQAVADPDFRFGAPGARARTCYDQVGKDALEPGDLPQDDVLTHQHYVLSHQAWHPGEQRRRGYHWPFGVQGQAFGRATTAKQQESAGLGVREVFAAEAAEADVEDLRSIFVNSRGKAFRSYDHEPVGGWLWASPDGSPAGVTAKSDVSAGDLIWGSCSPEQQRPDKDLGRCIREGRRNVTAETRAFGRPSAALPERQLAFQPPPRAPRAAAEAAGGAAVVISPSRLSSRGLSDDELAAPRGRAEVRSLLGAVGYQLGREQFDQLWEAAAGPQELASLDSVLRVCAQRGHVPGAVAKGGDARGESVVEAFRVSMGGG